MTEIFAAPPGTFIAHRDKGSKNTIKTPVVAFMFVQTGPVFPLCVMPFGGLTAGKALLHDTGFVSDPHAGLVFETLAEWEKVVDSAGYWKEKPAPAKPAETKTDRQLAEAGKVLGVDERAAGPAEQAGPKETVMVNTVKPKAIPDKPQRARKPRIFETNSWWMFPADDNAVARRIWMIPGGEIVPFEDDPDYTKIKQVEFVALKKDGWIIGDPRNEAAAESDDEDDGKSLI